MDSKALISSSSCAGLHVVNACPSYLFGITMTASISSPTASLFQLCNSIASSFSNCLHSAWQANRYEAAAMRVCESVTEGTSSRGHRSLMLHT